MRTCRKVSLGVGVALLSTAVAVQNSDLRAAAGGPAAQGTEVREVGPEPSVSNATAAAAEQEFGPVEVEEVAPLGSSESEVPAPGARPSPAPGGRRNVTIRHRPPVDENTHRVIKAKAASDPAAQEADTVEAEPTPLAPTITTSFVGLDRPSAANNGVEIDPPDTIVAKSNTRVLEATNSALRLFTTTGGVLQTRDLNTFFGASISNGFLFDPKVYFDRNATNRRFYVVALQTDLSSVSRIWLAVSRSSDPPNLGAANWCRYNINGQRNAGTVNASFADYPGLGVGADTLLISTNQFRFIDQSFTFAIVRAFKKNVLANNATACPALQSFIFQASSTVGDFTTAFTLQPVQHYTSPSSFSGTTNPAYLLSTHYGSSTIYRVWQVRNVGGASPTLRVKNVSGSFTYGLQPDAPQRNSSLLLDTGDNQVTQAAGVGNALSGVHGTLCQLGGGANESCIRVVRILVGQSSSGALTASISQETTFGGHKGVFYYWPGIAVNVSEQTAVDFLRSSASSFLSSRWAVKNIGSTGFGKTFPLTTGTCPQEISDRTGDYNGAQTDPANFTSFWLAGERATTIAGECQWQTRIIKVDP